jgi:hypothetical protein
MTLIVAMTMEEHLVTQVVVGAITIQVIDFQDVSICEVQFAPAAFPLLPLEQFRFDLMHHRMSLEALTPVQPIPIIRAGRSFHFGMSLDVRFTVRAYLRAFGCGKDPCALLDTMPVAIDDSVTSLVGMACFSPVHELMPQHEVASAKGLR